jgi:hypothetical protein
MLASPRFIRQVDVDELFIGKAHNCVAHRRPIRVAALQSLPEMACEMGVISNSRFAVPASGIRHSLSSCVGESRQRNCILGKGCKMVFSLHVPTLGHIPPKF